MVPFYISISSKLNTMKKQWFIYLIICLVWACQIEKETTQTAFDQEKWLTKEGTSYPYRAQMVDSVVYNDTIRSLSKQQILQILGQPDKREDNHIYYLISQSRIASWPLHTTFVVVKFTTADTVEWIKIHE